MKKRAIQTGCDLLLTICNHCVIVTTLMTIIGAFGFETPYFWLWMSLWIVPVYLYITRKNIQNILLFFVVQLVPVVVVFLLKLFIGIKLLILFVTIFYVITSIKVQYSEIHMELTLTPVVSIIVLGVAYITEVFWLKRNLGHYYLILAFIYMTTHVFQFFLERYISFLVVNQSSASNIPEKEILFSGLKQTCVYVACSITIMFLSINVEWLNFILRVIGRGIRVTARFLLSFIKPDPIEETEIVEEITEIAMSKGGGMFLEPGEPHPFWLFLEKVAIVAFFIGSAILIIKGVGAAYRYLKNNYRASDNKSYRIQNGPDIRESCEIEQNDRTPHQRFGFLNNAEKIRKIYRKHVLKNEKNIVGEDGTRQLLYLTAKECCEKLSADGLKVAYEKARYSNESVTSEDVKAVKISMK